MRFSIIVPFLNEEKYIEQCIKSLINQNFDRDEYEIIFVDNGSNDKSIELVQKYPQVKLIFENTPNVYAARNKALNKAKGKFIAFTDADCYVDRNWLTNLDHCLKDKQVAIVMGRRDFPNKKDVFLQTFADYENEKFFYTLKYYPKKFWFGFTNNLAIKKVVIDKVAGFRLLQVNGDIDLVQRVVSNNLGSVVYCPSAIIRHLEINHPWDWLKKIYRYGYHNTGLQNISEFSNLPVKVNLKIFQSMGGKQHYSLWRKFCALLALSTGFIAYRIGSIQVRLSNQSIIFENTTNHKQYK